MKPNAGGEPPFDQLHMDGRKWPDQVHWQFPAHRLGSDDHGAWAHVPAGTVARRGHEPPKALGVGFVILLPPRTWWTVEFYWEHPRHSVYVNIGTPLEWHGNRVTQIDLDLDVVRNVDGTIEVFDEEEFADHRERLGYPDHIVDGALAASREVVGLLERRSEPFGIAAEAWIDRARRHA